MVSSSQTKINKNMSNYFLKPKAGLFLSNIDEGGVAPHYFALRVEIGECIPSPTFQGLLIEKNLNLFL